MRQRVKARATKNTERRSSKHPVAFTALLELKEALLKERYEVCREVIAIAYEFGAKEIEVQYLLEDPRRDVRP